MEDCYSSADADHRFRIDAGYGGSTLQTFVNIAPAMQFIAKYQHHGDMFLSTGPAGKAAMRQAMSCLWQAEIITLSSVVANQRLDFQLYPSTIRHKDAPGGTLQAEFEFDSVRASCVAGYPKVLRFADTSGNNETAAIAVLAYGFDYWRGLPSALDPAYDWECVPSGLTGCSMLCDNPPGANGACSCPDASGPCHATGTLKELGFAQDAILEGF